MQRKLNISQYQKATAGDLNAIGDYARGSFDDLVRDTVDERNRYSGFAIVQSSAASVTVGAGRFFRNGEVYFRSDEGGVSLDVINNLPAVAKRIATVVAWGVTQDTNLQSREFLKDTVTRATEAREVSTESRRVANLDCVYGQENATPMPGAISSDYVAIANIILTPAGIESITMLTENQIGSTKKNGISIDQINKRLSAIGPELDTAKTNIAGLALGLSTKADFSFVKDIAIDLSHVKEEIGLPDDYLAWGADHLLTDDEIDMTFAGSTSAVEEGWRYPDADSALLPILLENPLDPKVIVQDNLAFPTYSNVIRLSVRGKDAEYPLADTTSENVNLVQRSVSRTVISYGQSQSKCTNTQFWRSGKFDEIAGIFTRDNGEQFAVDTASVTGRPGHWRYQIKKIIKATVTDNYFDRVVTTSTVNGSVVEQSFLNGADGYLTQIGLYFTKRAAAGDVRVMICKAKPTGEADLTAVIGQTVLLNADIKANANGTEQTLVTMTPTALNKGERYCVVAISNAPHFLAQVAGNKLAEGSIFYLQDGLVVQGPANLDMAMDLYFAEFTSPIVQLQLQPLELAGGIDKVDINADYLKFDSCSIEFQLRINNEWRTIGEDETLLTTTPNLAQFRAVFIGTKDVMPALGLTAARSEVKVSRPAPARTGITKPKLLPANSNNVLVRVRYENWMASVTSSNVTLLVGATYTTVETPDTITEKPAPDDPQNAIIREYTFNLAAPTNKFRIKEIATTTDIKRCDHVAGLAYVAF